MNVATHYYYCFIEMVLIMVLARKIIYQGVCHFIIYNDTEYQDKNETNCLIVAKT